MLRIGLPLNQTIDLFAIVDLVVAAIVTTHVLLNKRDVRGSIGWIGLAWLSPLLGSFLYFVLGINRVARRAARLRQRSAHSLMQGHFAQGVDASLRLQDHILAIARVGDRLTNSSVVAGNSIRMFRSGDEAYPAMLQAIHSAQTGIALASYIFRADHVGMAFVEALTAAHRRGVDIRVLVDGIGSGYFRSSACAALRRAGIPVQRFLHDWLPWRMPFLNMRNHKKLLIVDGHTGFTGGLNLGAENLHRLRSRHVVEDIHFEVRGPAVSILMRSFAEDWAFTCAEVLDDRAWWPNIDPAGSVILRGISSGPDDDEVSLETTLAAAVGSAKFRLRIVTPYFLPDQRLMSDIALAAMRGVTVEIIVPGHSNRRLVDWALRSHLGFFAVPGLAIYLAPEPFDHSKMVTVDGLWCGLGSPNWDQRSLRLNFEFMLECYDALFISEVDTLIDRKIARAARLHLAQIHGRSYPVKLRDAAARLLLPYL
jgi:cardiolipin synthase A/B